MPPPSSSQTIGPFFHEALAWATAPGSGPIELVGRVLDGNAQAIDDALLELWIEGAIGAHGLGFLRQPTDAKGGFRFLLPEPKPDSPLAYVCVFARGCLNHHFTAVFPRLVSHPLLDAAPRSRRDTLIAQQESASRYRWDLRLQGEGETVFFDYA